MILLSPTVRDLMAAAQALYAAGRLAEAEAAYRAALSQAPGHAVVMHNLGAVVAAHGRHQEAIKHFEDAIAAEPRYAAAHYSLALTLLALGRTADAIQSLSRTCGLEPQHYAAHRALGFLWLAQGNRGRSLDHFARTYELRRGVDHEAIAAQSLTSATRLKLEHDARQFRYLAGRHRNSRYFETLARNYEQVAKELSDDVAPLNPRQTELLGEGYNTAIHIRDAAEIADGAVSPRPDRDAIVRQFTATGAAWFDDLLTPAALASLRRFLLESTIWHDFSHIDGFVASYLEDGLASPLLLQIADAIRAAFPELLGPHPLSQAWAFKGIRPQAAVDAHADDAAVSINFWVTRDEANLRPGAGGLTICTVPPPADWVMTDYEGDQERIVTFLEQNARQCLRVPYRENRAALFRSRLFHLSDAPEFAPAYEDHRINITLLFGHQGDV
jgi:tetratricopeptide (TPR) repeat protein